MAMDEARMRRSALLMMLSAAQRMRSGLKDGAPLGASWPANTAEECREVERTVEALRECLQMAKNLKWMDGPTRVYTKDYSDDMDGMTKSFGIRREVDNPDGPLAPLPDAVLVLKEALHDVGMWHPTEAARAEAEQATGYLKARNPERAADEMYEAKVWLRVFQKKGLIDPGYVIADEERDGRTVFYLARDGVRMTPSRFHAGREGR